MINVLPYRKSPHDIEELNYSLEAYVCRNREIVRDFTSRASTKGINPLTKLINRAGKNL